MSNYPQGSVYYLSSQASVSFGTMRCSITLTIISAVTMTAAQSRTYNKDSSRNSLNESQPQSRDFDHVHVLQPRSPIPGSGNSKGKTKHVRTPNGIHTQSGRVMTDPFRWMRDGEEVVASRARLERNYAMKNMGLPPLRHGQLTPIVDRHGEPWSTLRSRRDPAHTMSPGRAAAFEMATSAPRLANVLQPKFSSGPAELMVRYDVLQKQPGAPGYIPPSPFRASRVPELSVMSIPERQPPRSRESGASPFGTVKNNEKVGCLGCLGL